MLKVLNFFKIGRILEYLVKKFKFKKTQKLSFIIFQIVCILVSFILIAIFHPKKTGWWIFQHTKYYAEYFIGFAYIISSFYLILLTYWYNNSDKTFNWKISVKAFLICGVTSVLLSLCILYPLWDFIGFYEVESGWWIFKSKKIVARDPIIKLLEDSGAIAGPVEELSKLIAVLLIPSVRKSIKDEKSGTWVSVLCAFGFAMIENIMYFISNEKVLLIRANPAHAVFSVVWGSALGKLIDQKISFKEFLKYLLYGMGLHAAWNYFASFHIILFCILFIMVSFYGLFYIKKRISC